MIFKVLLISLIFIFNAWSFDKDFSTVNDRVPLEFSYLFESLKSEVKSPVEKIKLVGICQELDKNLGSLSKDQIYLLMKSEVIKNVLQFKFKKIKRLVVDKNLIRSIERSYELKQKSLNSFSGWIWRSIIAELKHREDLGLISEKSFDVKNFTGAKLLLAQRMNRYLIYLTPWMDKMDNLDAEEFNELTKEVSWVVLRRLNDRSMLFKRFASTASSDVKVTIFNIPQKLLDLHPEDIKRMQNDQTPLSLKDESIKEKNKALEEVNKATVEDMSPVSDDLARELEKKEK